MRLAPTSTRLYGLDLLRCLLMLFGPLYHVGATFSGGRFDLGIPLLTSITYITHPFRMGLFFFISGYFTQLIIEQKGFEVFRTNRRITLFVPLIFSCLVIIPITDVSLRLLKGNVRLSVYHLWFLITLGLLNAFIIFFPKKFRFIVRKCSKLDKSKLIIYFGILSIGLRIFGSKISAFTSGETQFSGELCLVFIFYPLKYFVHLTAGALAYTKNLNFKVTAKALLAAFAFYLVFYLLREEHPHEGAPSQRLIATLYELPEFIASTVLGLALFFYFKNMHLQPTKLLAFVTKSSLTVYLVHQMFIFFFTRFFSGSLAAAMVVLFLTYLASFAIFWLMNRTPFTRALIGVRTVSRTNN